MPTAWSWGYIYPGFAACLVPLASNPVEIAGRNRIWRKFLIDAIEQDPSWNNGNYTQQPRGLKSAIGFLMMAQSARRAATARIHCLPSGAGN